MEIPNSYQTVVGEFKKSEHFNRSLRTGPKTETELRLLDALDNVKSKNKTQSQQFTPSIEYIEEDIQEIIQPKPAEEVVYDPCAEIINSAVLLYQQDEITPFVQNMYNKLEEIINNNGLDEMLDFKSKCIKELNQIYSYCTNQTETKAIGLLIKRINRQAIGITEQLGKKLWNNKKEEKPSKYAYPY